MLYIMYNDVYTPPTVTVDGVILQIVDGELAVLLIRRANDPFKGEWALPGGYSARGQTTRQALDRVLEEKAGVYSSQLGLVEQLYTFDSVARDPRGHAVSVTYMGLAKSLEPVEKSAQNTQFFSVVNMPKLAYDHDKIIAYAHERLKAKLSYTNVAVALLPELFTLTQLQSTYEAILGIRLDKRNFRKKLLSLDMVQETEEMLRDGAHRPAQLYAFREHTLQVVAQPF
jgi:8-oxo-dGTP diphosphatase